MMAGYDTVRQLRGNLPAIRCNCCNRLLYRGVVQSIEIKCPKCGMIHLFEGYEQRSRGGAIANGLAVSRVITDSAGRIVTIPGRPQRVIALNASNLGLYCATGGNIVGRAATHLLPPEVAEQVKHIPTVGIPPRPDVERIISMKPDLVLGMHAPMHHELAVVLEKTGIPVLLQALEHYTDVLKTLRLYGELSGHPEQAAARIAAIEERRRELLREHTGKPSPKILILWGTAEGWYMALAKSFVGDLVKRLGGVNVADMIAFMDESPSYAPLCLETLPLAQPDVILAISHRPEMEGAEFSCPDLNVQPGWQKLDAVKKRAVYTLPYHLFAANPGPRLGDALQVLADYMYKGCEL